MFFIFFVIFRKLQSFQPNNGTIGFKPNRWNHAIEWHVLCVLFRHGTFTRKCSVGNPSGWIISKQAAMVCIYTYIYIYIYIRLNMMGITTGPYVRGFWAYIAVSVVNYGNSNAIVLEIPWFTARAVTYHLSPSATLSCPSEGQGHSCSHVMPWTSHRTIYHNVVSASPSHNP